MSTAFPQIFELSVPDRLRLLEELWDSIADAPDSLPLLGMKVGCTTASAGDDLLRNPGSTGSTSPIGCVNTQKRGLGRLSDAVGAGL